MNRDQASVDLVTLTSRLRDSGKLDEVGGAGFIADVYGDVPTPHLVVDYIRIAVEAAKRRSLIFDMQIAIAGCYDRSIPIDKTIQSVDTLIQSMFRSMSSGQHC